MREAENIREVEALGIDLMGFIFWPKSSRYVSERPAYLPTNCKRVGVFVDEDIETVKRIADDYALDFIQLHGHESADYCAQLKGLKLIKAISTQAVGTTQQVKLPTAIIITRVTERRNMVEKYDVAIVKRPYDFSNDTYNKTYNEFSQFVASNKTAEEIEANAMKSGYMVQQRKGMFASEHNVAGISSTRDALRWIFNQDTKVGEISEIYACGNNDHLLVVILDGKNDGKFRSLESVKDMIQTEVSRDKKAEVIRQRLAAVKDVVAASKVAGALPVDTIKHVTFNSPVFISSVGGSEYSLSGAVAKAAKGAFVNGIKGQAAVYAFQVTNDQPSNIKVDDKNKQSTYSQVANQQLRGASRFMQELFERANVKDNRYIFY